MRRPARHGPRPTAMEQPGCAAPVAAPIFGRPRAAFYRDHYATPEGRIKATFGAGVSGGLGTGATASRKPLATTALAAAGGCGCRWPRPKRAARLTPRPNRLSQRLMQQKECQIGRSCASPCPTEPPRSLVAKVGHPAGQPPARRQLRLLSMPPLIYRNFLSDRPRLIAIARGNGKPFALAVILSPRHSPAGPPTSRSEPTRPGESPLMTSPEQQTRR